MSFNPATIYCEGDGCISFGRCPKSLTQEIRKQAEAKGRVVDFYQDPLKLACWRDKPYTEQEVEEAIDRIDPKGKWQAPEEPSWDD